MNRWSEADGFAVHRNLVDDDVRSELIEEAETLFRAFGRRPAGVRGVLRHSELFARVASDGSLKETVQSIVGDGAFVTRSILFDKTPEANWDVSWHQDTTIAVRERHDVEAFGPWSMKDQIPHVRPPAWVLQGMVTIRLHLDDCPGSNGALLVVPGSHRDGFIDPIPTFAVLESRKFVCECPAGGAVLMRPLILHASRKAATPSHRRVLHLEFASQALPHPLEWARF